MKLSSLIPFAILGAFTTDALLIPSNANALARRSEHAFEQKRDSSFLNDLWKRKGGGGGGKGGGSTGSSSSGSSSSGSSSGGEDLPFPFACTR
jgi:uncharacterized membrane protein YgcG